MTDYQGLTVGTLNLPANEGMVLRSMIRLLGGKDDLKVRFDDNVGACNVVFVPGDGLTRLRGACVSVRVISPTTLVLPNVPVYGLSVPAPLRLSSVVEVLRLAYSMLGSPNEGGLKGLFHGFTSLMHSGERRMVVFTLLDGRQAVVDFSGERVWLPMPMDELFVGDYCVGTAARAAPELIEACREVPPMSLREFLWSTSHQLGAIGAQGAPLEDTYRMNRWPDASALSRRGYPQLCALLTNRAMTTREASECSELSLPAVNWFIEVCLALSIAVPTAVAPAPQAPLQVAPAAPVSRSILGRLRERLKLW